MEINEHICKAIKFQDDLCKSMETNATTQSNNNKYNQIKSHKTYEKNKTQRTYIKMKINEHQ